jgi:ribosomal-protein-alanine N-acetyltransferase
VIRAAALGDLAAMMAIEREVFSTSAWTEQQMTDELTRIGESRWYAVADLGTHVAGYVGLYLSVPDADVQTIAIASTAQGAGLGRELLAAAIAHAWNCGCTRLFLEVRADNEAALALYQQAGFIRMGRRNRYYPDGADAITMRLRKHEVPDLQEAVRVL